MSIKTWRDEFMDVDVEDVAQGAIPAIVKNRMPAKITNLRQFILFCDTHDDDTIYDIFEYNCSDDVRNRVYSFAAPGSPEPFRSAMINLGFSDFSC